MTRTLVVADADRIQHYLFASSRLRLIRGSSTIQRSLCSSDAPPGSLVADGGRIVAVFDTTEEAEQFRRDLAERFWNEARAATVTSVAAGWPQSQRFADALKGLERQLDLLKTAQAGALGPPAQPYGKICETCGLGTASALHQFSGEDKPVPICTACHLRAEAGGGEDLYQGLTSRDAPVEDLNELGALSKPEGYLALIYLDLDGMGRQFEAAADEDEGGDAYAKLSKGLDDALFESVKAGVRAIERHFEESSRIPFELLLLAGDEFAILTPAHLAAGFLKGFREAFKEDRPGGATFSAGVVWTHARYPIRSMFEQAKRLASSAKRVQDTDSLDFAVVTASMAGDVVEERVRTGGSADWTPTRRPYAFDVWSKLCGAVDEWKVAGFPSSKIHELYEIAYRGGEQSVLDSLRLKSRLRNEHGKLLSELIESSGETLGIWSENDYGNHDTPVADLAELWAFVGAE